MERDDVEVNQLGVMVFEFRLQGLRTVRCVRKDKPMKIRLAQLVINAFAVNQKLRHSISGFDLEIFVSGVLAK